MTRVLRKTNLHSFKLKEIADLINASLVGDPEKVITNIGDIRDCTEEDITFLAFSKFDKYLKETRAGAIIVGPDVDIIEGRNFLVCPNPHKGFALAIESLRPLYKPPLGISEKASVSEKATIGEYVTIMDFAYVEEGATIGDNTIIYPNVFIGKDTVIGSNVILYPNVTVREECIIGSNVTIHSNSEVGSDGFGYAHEADNSRYKVLQVGRVILGDRVELGSNVTIDRGAIGDTVVHEGVKIDNQCQIAHNVVIGKHSVIVAGSDIAGSTIIGEYVTMAGQSGTQGHMKIADHSVVAARGGVVGDIDKAGLYSGWKSVV